MGDERHYLKKKTYRKQKENAVNNNHWFKSCYVSAVLSVFKSSIFFKSYFKYVKFSLTCRGEEESGWTLCQDNKKTCKNKYTEYLEKAAIMC